MPRSVNAHREGAVSVYGRVPVLEALLDAAVEVTGVTVARTAKGPSLDAILAAAGHRGLVVRRVAPEKLTRLSGNGRHDQGVVAEVAAPGIVDLDRWLGGTTERRDGAVLVLDGITNPANVGMIVRTATAAGLAGTVLPRAGSPDVGPLVIKASAGVALRATLLRCATAASGVRELATAGFVVYGLRGRDAEPLFGAPLAPRAAYVIGNETEGISESVAAGVDGWLSLPMDAGVESLNVASVAAVVAYEVLRRRSAPT